MASLLSKHPIRTHCCTLNPVAMLHRRQPAPLPPLQQKQVLSAQEQRRAVDALRKELGLSGNCQLRICIVVVPQILLQPAPQLPVSAAQMMHQYKPRRWPRSSLAVQGWCRSRGRQTSQSRGR